MSNNQMITETNEVPILGDYDVIIAGGGPAGVGAAYAAGKSGAKTLLIEQMNFLGGMWTGGLVNPVFDFQNKKGVLKRIIETLQDKNGLGWGGMWNACFHYEEMKVLLDDLMEEAGVTVLCGTVFSKPIMEGDTIKGIIIENKGGRGAYLAKTVIDCTGDADVAFRAGAECLVGRDGDGKVQAKTLMFLLSNVRFDQQNWDDVYNLVEKANKEHGQNFQLPYERPYIIQVPGGNLAVVQLTHMRGHHPLEAQDLTKANRIGRQQAQAVVAFMKRYIPELRDIELAQTAPLLGVRESRRIVGEYTVTAEDLKAGRQFEDGICDVTFGVDIHSPDGKEQTCFNVPQYQIPFRSLVPKQIDNLLVAGRCISGTHEAMASYRVTGNCIAMGEAAGYAAFEAVKQKKTVREIAKDDILKHIK